MDINEKRTQLLKDMDKYLRKNVNDEEIFMSWLSCGVPDEATQDDYESIAEDNESYNECLELFAKILIWDSKN